MTIDSSLLYTREDGSQDFVHDSYRDFFLAKMFASQNISINLCLDSPSFYGVIPFYAGIVQDGSLVLPQLTKKKAYELIIPSLDEIRFISEQLVEDTLSGLFGVMDERNIIIANTILEVTKRGRRSLDDYALRLIGESSRVHLTIGLVYFNVSAHDKALSQFEKSLTFSKEGSELAADCMYQIGRTHQLVTRSKKAIKYLNEALAIYERTDGKEARIKEAQTTFELGRILKYIKGPEDARRLLQKSATLFKELGDELDYARSEIQIAETYRREKWYKGGISWKEAESHYQVALPIFEKFNYERGIIEVYLGLSNIREKEGKLKESEELVIKALQLCKKLYFKRRSGYCYAQLARTLSKQGRNEEALQNIETAIKIWSDLEHDEGLSHGLEEKAEIERRIGNKDQAEECDRRSKELRLKVQQDRVID